jgi:type II secretory pathway component PulK
MKSFCRTSEPGFILVTVLLVSALFLSASVAYAVFARQEMRRVANEEFALSSRVLAYITCREAGGWIASDKTESDSRLEYIYSGVPIELGYGDYKAFVAITPQDDKIPINGMMLPDGTTMKNEYAYPWSLAWSNLGFDKPPPVLDFIDSNRDARPGGREDDYFPNRPLSDLSELLRLPEIDRARLYSGVSADIAIDALFTVYGDEGLNINMAAIPVLRILDPGIGPDVAEAVAAFRLQNAIQSASDLERIAGFSSTVATRLKNVINYKSNFFLVRLKVERGTFSRNFEAMLRRAEDGFEIVKWEE